MLNREIQVKVTGLRNPYYNDPTDSFQLTTFNYVSDNFYYYIDSVTEGLVINSDCSYPCKTCSKDSPDKCLSCYDSTVVQNGLPFLQLETCVEKCATSRYYDKEAL